MKTVSLLLLLSLLLPIFAMPVQAQDNVSQFCREMLEEEFDVFFNVFGWTKFSSCVSFLNSGHGTGANRVAFCTYSVWLLEDDFHYYFKNFGDCVARTSYEPYY